MSALDEILKFSLPTRLSRWTAGLSIPLLGAAAGLPGILQKLQMPVSIQSELPVRIAAISTTGFLATLLTLILVLHYYRSSGTPRVSREIILDTGDPLLSILALIAKYHSQEIPATPKRISVDLGLDPEIVLAHMWKCHNEQFITFRNDGKKPEPDTPFFLSQKAWEHIKIVRA